MASAVGSINTGASSAGGMSLKFDPATLMKHSFPIVAHLLVLLLVGLLLFQSVGNMLRFFAIVL